MIFNFKFTKDAKTLGGHSADEFLKTGDTASNSEKLGGRGADEFYPKTGGYLSGNVTVQKTDASEARCTVQNSLRTASLLANGSGELGLYDTSKGWVFKSTADGTNTFNGTASGNLPLTGGTVKGSVKVDNDTVSHCLSFISAVSGNAGIYDDTIGEWLIKSLLNGTNTFNGKATGNGNPVHIGTAAPSDTSALWVDISA